AAAAALGAVKLLDVPAAELVQGGLRLFTCTVAFNDVTMLDAIADAYSKADNKIARANVLLRDVGRAFCEANLAKCGGLISSLYGLALPVASFGLVTGYADIVIELMREARRRGWRAGMDWRAPIAACRAFAEKAKA